ncbi:MAG: hypothetical protein JRH04_14940, partial [Deltaproteobacteria bacterium]|nr:hypothetical protein [Deltaproteobacteria bacterium]
MNSSKRSRKFLIIPAVVLGALVLILVVKFKQVPKQLEVRERLQAVRVIPAPEVALAHRAKSSGSDPYPFSCKPR